MKFSIQREPLLNALQRISSVIEKKHTMEILGNVLFEAKKENGSDKITLSGTDLEAFYLFKLFTGVYGPESEFEFHAHPLTSEWVKIARYLEYFRDPTEKERLK